MAELLSYFKFIPSHYMSGQIQFCAYDVQGLYMNVCCFYWQRECLMTKEELFRKYKEHGLLQELIDEDIIKIESGNVVIEFLIEQFEPLRLQHLKLSEGGRKGAKQAHENRLALKNKLSQQSGTSELPLVVEESLASENKTGTFFRVGMTRYDYPVSKYVLDECQITISEFMPTMKPVTVEQVLAQMDSENAGMSFTNDNHIKNTFKKIARILKAKSTVGNNTDSKATISNRPNIDN